MIILIILFCTIEQKNFTVRWSVQIDILQAAGRIHQYVNPLHRKMMQAFIIVKVHDENECAGVYTRDLVSLNNVVVVAVESQQFEIAKKQSCYCNIDPVLSAFL